MRLSSNIFVSIVILAFAIGGSILGFIAWKNTNGLLFYKPPPTIPLMIDPLLPTVVKRIEEKESLTASPSSVTLSTGTAQPKTVEIINGSGTQGAARILADRLIEKGFAIGRVANGTTTAQTIVSFKQQANSLRSAIGSSIGTQSATIQLKTLEETYPFDIQIKLGKQ